MGLEYRFPPSVVPPILGSRVTWPGNTNCLCLLFIILASTACCFNYRGGIGWGRALMMTLHLLNFGNQDDVLVRVMGHVKCRVVSDL